MRERQNVIFSFLRHFFAVLVPHSEFRAALLCSHLTVTHRSSLPYQITPCTRGKTTHGTGYLNPTAYVVAKRKPHIIVHWPEYTAVHHP